MMPEAMMGEMPKQTGAGLEVRTAEESKAELTPLQEMHRFLAKRVMALEKVSGSKESMKKWGTEFYNQIGPRVSALRGFLGEDFNLEGLGEEMVGLASNDRMRETIRRQWAGLRGELAVADVLDDLSGDGEIVLVRAQVGDNTEILERFDGVGGADFVLFRTKDNVIVGVQVKVHKGGQIGMFNAASERGAQYLEDEIEDLKQIGVMEEWRRVENNQGAFEKVVKEVYGEEAEGVLIYLLAGKHTIDREKGVFKNWFSKGVREAMLRVINGETVAARLKPR